MGILTGNEIRIQQQSGGLYIEEFSEDRLNPNSYNLRLAPELLVYTEAVLDPKQNNQAQIVCSELNGLLVPACLHQGGACHEMEPCNLCETED